MVKVSKCMMTKHQIQPRVLVYLGKRKITLLDRESQSINQEVSKQAPVQFELHVYVSVPLQNYRYLMFCRQALA